MVRVIRTEGGDAVVMQFYDALRLAEQEGLDLVEVSPNQSPPVCRLLDYGKFKYIAEKKAREAGRTQKVRTGDLREIKLSPNIAENDVEYRIKMVGKHLDEGSKVKVAVYFKGRQITHPELAVKVLRRVAEAVASKAKLERPPTMEARALSIILAPANQVQRPPDQEPEVEPGLSGDITDGSRNA